MSSNAAVICVGPLLFCKTLLLLLLPPPQLTTPLPFRLFRREFFHPKEGIVVERTSAALKDYQVDGNKKMIAIGLMNVVGSSTSCYVTMGEASAPTGADPIAMMEFYMKKAAQEEKFKQPKQSKDEMPPPASLQGLDFLIR